MYGNQVPDMGESQMTSVVVRRSLPGIVISEGSNNVVPTQASQAPSIHPTDKEKKKLEFHRDVTSDSEDDGWEPEVEEASIKDAYGVGQEWSDDDSSGDDNYDPAKDDDEYASYGVDDDFLFDWLTEEGGVTQGVGTSIACVKEVTEQGQYRNDQSVEDNEDMFVAMDSDEEMIGPEYISSDEENARQKYPEFNPAVDMINPWFCNGMLFATPKNSKSCNKREGNPKGVGTTFCEE